MVAALISIGLSIALVSIGFSLVKESLKDQGMDSGFLPLVLVGCVLLGIVVYFRFSKSRTLQAVDGWVKKYEKELASLS